MTTESKPVRYFDHELQAWVTVLPTATAAGAHTVDQLRPMNAAGWLAGKSAAKAKNPGLHRRSGRDLQRAAKAGVDDLLFDRLRIADAYVRTRPYVTATGLGNAAVRGERHPLPSIVRRGIGDQLAAILVRRGLLRPLPDGSFQVTVGSNRRRRGARP